MGCVFIEFPRKRPRFLERSTYARFQKCSINTIQQHRHTHRHTHIYMSNCHLVFISRHLHKVIVMKFQATVSSSQTIHTLYRPPARFSCDSTETRLFQIKRGHVQCVVPLHAYAYHLFSIFIRLIDH